MEFLDVVDGNDHVVGRVPKKEIYDKSLIHRIIHILVFNKNGDLLLQLRSAKCSFCPHHWSTSAGGHVRSGESCEAAAMREYTEELGTKSELEFFSKDFYRGKGSPDKFLITFKTAHNGPFKPDKGAVERAEFFSMKEIQMMINSGEKFHPELLFLLRRRFGFR